MTGIGQEHTRGLVCLGDVWQQPLLQPQVPQYLRAPKGAVVEAGGGYQPCGGRSGAVLQAKRDVRSRQRESGGGAEGVQRGSRGGLEGVGVGETIPNSCLFFERETPGCASAAVPTNTHLRPSEDVRPTRASGQHRQRVEWTIKTLISHLITCKFDSPTDSGGSAPGNLTTNLRYFA
eukprot:1195013-Prorocentrum_minimum.AAC.5